MARIRQISSKTDLVKYIILKRNIRNIIVKTIRILVAFTVITMCIVIIYHRANIRSYFNKTHQTVQAKVSKFYINNANGIRIKLQKHSLIDVELLTNFVMNYTRKQDYRYTATTLINDIKKMYPIIEDISIRYDITNGITIFNVKEKKMLAILLSESCDSRIDNNNNNKLIAEDGTVINYIKIANSDILLSVCGDFHDGQDLLGIKQELTKYKLYDKIKYIKFYTSGRFELMLKNNLLVKMPQKDWKNAMLKFLKMDSEYALSNGQKKIKYIDLRLNDKVYVKEL